MNKLSTIGRGAAFIAAAVIILLPALLSAQATANKPPEKPQVFDMGTFKVSAPPEGKWKVIRDEKQNGFHFTKYKEGLLTTLAGQGRGTIVAAFFRPVELSDWRLAEEELADLILKGIVKEEAEDLESPGSPIEMGKTVFKDKKLHFVKLNEFFPNSGNKGNNDIYLYFPPDFKKSRGYFYFYSSFVHQAGGFGYVKLYKNPGSEPIQDLIDSLEIVDPLQAVPGPEGELLRAAAAGDVEAARQAIGKGAKVDAAAPEMTALSAAAFHGHRDIVDLLLGQGANVNKTDEEGGRSPLHQALIGGEPEIAEILIKSGADVNMRTKKGFSALMYAVVIGHSGVVSLLIERGADVNAKTNDGETALIFAAQSGSKEMAQLLMAKGADMNIQENDGWTALMYAVRGAHADVVRSLLESGAEVNLKVETERGKTGKGWTALMSAVTRGDLEIARVLIEKGADVNTKLTDGGWTPLSFALLDEKFEIATKLIEAGADVNQKTEKGATPLMFAAEKAPADMVKLLLEKGADVNAKNDKKVTALKLAKYKKRADIVKMLQAAGAKG